MSINEFFNLFLIISAVQGIAFFMYIFFSKNKLKKSIFFISLLVLAIALNNLQSWFIIKNFITAIKAFQIPWHFLIAPLFYQFLVYYLDIKKRSRKLLEYAFFAFIILVIGRFTIILVLDESNSLFIEKYTTYEEIFSLCVSISVFFYAFHVLSKKENLFIKILSFDNLRWIYTFFKLGLFSYIFWIVALAVTVALGFDNFIYAYYPLRIFTTILIYWIGFQAIQQLRILNERKSIRVSSKNTLQKKESVDNNKDFDIIKNVLLENNFFAEPKLTVDLLASKVNISSSKVSSVIKEQTRKNFNDFINEYRIVFVKEMLKNPDYKNYTVIAIGLEAGFNSKSSFYQVFKKHEGCTPSQYQKKQHS